MAYVKNRQLRPLESRLSIEIATNFAMERDCVEAQ
jgi:hypothetical protein